jgi:hypothetical protein
MCRLTIIRWISPHSFLHTGLPRDTAWISRPRRAPRALSARFPHASGDRPARHLDSARDTSHRSHGSNRKLRACRPSPQDRLVRSVQQSPNNATLLARRMSCAQERPELFLGARLGEPRLEPAHYRRPVEPGFSYAIGETGENFEACFLASVTGGWGRWTRGATRVSNGGSIS